MISHSIRNKVDSIRVEYKYLEKKIYRDSIIIKEVPVEIEVEKTVYPKSYWIMMITLILIVGVRLFKIYRKFVVI